MEWLIYVFVLVPPPQVVFIYPPIRTTIVNLSFFICRRNILLPIHCRLGRISRRDTPGLQLGFIYIPVTQPQNSIWIHGYLIVPLRFYPFLITVRLYPSHPGRTSSQFYIYSQVGIFFYL